MTETFYSEEAFVARLPGYAIDTPLLRTLLGELTVSVYLAEVYLVETPGPGVIVTWEGTPSATDLSRVEAVIAAFPGTLITTSEPSVYESFGVTTSEDETTVVKIEQTTIPLNEGTYRVSWSSSLRMEENIADTGMQADLTLTRSDGTSFHQDDFWDRANRHAYNGSQPFPILYGQTISALLTFHRIGESGVAEMRGARITIDKIS